MLWFMLVAISFPKNTQKVVATGMILYTESLFSGQPVLIQLPPNTYRS